MNTHSPPDRARPTKPKMLFFRTVDGKISAFIVDHLRQQLDCLRLSFDVTLIEGDCDYDRLCDTHRPDIAMFESGIYSRRSRIDNPRSHPSVPKIGFFNGDPYCSSRLTFLQNMRQLEIQTYFTLSTRLSEFMTEESADIFYWPNFIDPDIHRDYGLPKAIPILFTGSLASHYPWRNRVRQALAPRYPILSCPHPGWFNARAQTRVATGSEYARLINASDVTPTCGTIADEIVRKHFEIPACRSLLVTERTAGAVAAGFVDMENCVFAEPETVVDKLELLLRDPDRMAAITDAGHRLVHARHTIHHRDQILQWFRLRSLAGAGARIVQPTPFSPLSLGQRDAPRERAAEAHGRLRRLLDEGRDALATRSYEAAARAFTRCLNYHPLPEALVGLVRCQLHLGRPDEAVDGLGSWIDGVVARYDAPAPDPVEYALLIAGLLCQDRTDLAIDRIARFPNLAHPEMTGAIAATAALAPNHSSLTAQPAGTEAPESASLHRSLHRDAAGWLAELAEMLTACGRPDQARRVREAAKDPGIRHVGNAPAARSSRSPAMRRLSARRSIAATARHKALAPLVARLARAMTRDGRLQRFAALPLARRFRKFDDFVIELRGLVPRVSAANTLLVPGAARSIYVDEFLAGLAVNPELGTLHVVNRPGAPALRAERLGAGDVRHRALADLAGDDPVERFDLVFVESASVEGSTLRDLCLQADRVILSGIDEPAGYALLNAIIEAGAHGLLAHDPAYGSGYAILERRLARNPAPRPSPPAGTRAAEAVGDQTVSMP